MSFQEKIRLLQNYINNDKFFDNVKNNPTKYKYMVDNACNMIKLFINNGFFLNSKTWVNSTHTHPEIEAYINTSSTNPLNECISFRVYGNKYDWLDPNHVLYYSYNIFVDKKNMTYCPDGFGIYLSQKTYYNKQFINLLKIHTVCKG